MNILQVKKRKSKYKTQAERDNAIRATKRNCERKRRDRLKANLALKFISNEKTKVKRNNYVKDLYEEIKKLPWDYHITLTMKNTASFHSFYNSQNLMYKFLFEKNIIANAFHTVEDGGNPQNVHGHALIYSNGLSITTIKNIIYNFWNGKVERGFIKVVKIEDQKHLEEEAEYITKEVNGNSNYNIAKQKVDYWNIFKWNEVLCLDVDLTEDTSALSTNLNKFKPQKKMQKLVRCGCEMSIKAIKYTIRELKKNIEKRVRRLFIIPFARYL